MSPPHRDHHAGVPPVSARGDIHVANPTCADPLSAIIISGTSDRPSGWPRGCQLLRGASRIQKRVLEADGAGARQDPHPGCAFNLLKTDQLASFLAKTPYQGAPLATRMGVAETGRTFRGKEMTCYHKEWLITYRFGITCAAFTRPSRDSLRRATCSK